MNFDSNSWAGKSYRFSCRVMAKFGGSVVDPTHTNICQFVRMVFIWLPVVAAVHVAFIAWVMFVLLYFPIIHFGVGYGIFWMVIAGLVVTILIIWGLVVTIKWMQKPVLAAGHSISRTQIGREAGVFFALLARYFRDVSEKICTPMKIERVRHD